LVLLSCTVEEAASRDRHMPKPSQHLETRTDAAGGPGAMAHPEFLEKINTHWAGRAEFVVRSLHISAPPASTTAHQRLNALPSPPLSPAPARPSARQTLRLCPATTSPLPSPAALLPLGQCSPAQARPPRRRCASHPLLPPAAAASSGLWSSAGRSAPGRLAPLNL
jgi:hypothetical protein